MEELIKARFQACKNHPEKQEIFKLESLLLRSPIPYFFNFWEELRPTPFNDALDPETAIDWEKYNFLIEVGDRVGRGLSMISVCFNHQGDNTLLELLDMRLAAENSANRDNLTAEDGILYVDLTAEKAMEIIQCVTN